VGLTKFGYRLLEREFENFRSFSASQYDEFGRFFPKKILFFPQVLTIKFEKKTGDVQVCI
jgi:hypothetical protein